MVKMKEPGMAVMRDGSVVKLAISFDRLTYLQGYIWSRHYERDV
jgi:hypothetical protein